LLIGARVDGLAALLGFEELEKLWGADQAADMGREDAIDAAFHRGVRRFALCYD
jgi:hypothetical protein